MAKVTPEAADAFSEAIRNRSVKQYDRGEKETVIRRVIYDDKARPINSHVIGRIEHGK